MATKQLRAKARHCFNQLSFVRFLALFTTHVRMAMHELPFVLHEPKYFRNAQFHFSVLAVTQSLEILKSGPECKLGRCAGIEHVQFGLRPRRERLGIFSIPGRYLLNPYDNVARGRK